MEKDNELNMLLKCLPKDPSVAIKILANVMLSIISEYSQNPENDLASLHLAMKADLHKQLKEKIAFNLRIELAQPAVEAALAKLNSTKGNN